MGGKGRLGNSSNEERPEWKDTRNKTMDTNNKAITNSQENRWSGD